MDQDHRRLALRMIKIDAPFIGHSMLGLMKNLNISKAMKPNWLFNVQENDFPESIPALMAPLSLLLHLFQLRNQINCCGLLHRHQHDHRQCGRTAVYGQGTGLVDVGSFSFPAFLGMGAGACGHAAIGGTHNETQDYAGLQPGNPLVGTDAGAESKITHT